MSRTGSSKHSESRLEKTKSKEDTFGQKLGHSSAEENKVMASMKDNNLKNSYAFQIRFADREKTVFFPKDEVEKLATDIGIDIDRDKSKYIWFLQQALISELPFGWQKEQDLSGKTIYHNTFNNVISDCHPNIYKFRIAFNDVLKTEMYKQKLAEEGLKSMTKNEKIYLQIQLNSLSNGDKKSLAKAVRSTIAKDDEKTAGDLTKQIIKCKGFISHNK